MVVEKLSIVMLVIYFCIYLGTHIALGYYVQQKKKEIELKPGNPVLEKNFKKINIFFKAYPAIWVVIIIILLYGK